MPYATAVGSLIRPQRANPRSPYLYRYVLLTAADAITLGGDWGYIAAAARPDEADLLKRIEAKRPAALPDLEIEYAAAQAAAFQQRSAALLRQYFGDRPAALAELLSTKQPVIVQHLPEDDQTRADFAVALAAIWPPSLRSLVSFALRVPSIEEADVQFKFLSAGQERQITRKAGQVYDFQTGQLVGSSAEPSSYVEQVLAAVGSSTLREFQGDWDETAARLFRYYGDVVVARQFLDRQVAWEVAPNDDEYAKRWLALLDDDQSRTEAERVAGIRSLAEWLHQQNQPLPEKLLDLAKHYPGTESAI